VGLDELAWNQPLTLFIYPCQENPKKSVSVSVAVSVQSQSQLSVTLYPNSSLPYQENILPISLEGMETQVS